MKKLIYITLALVAVAFTSCDKIKGLISSGPSAEEQAAADSLAMAEQLEQQEMAEMMSLINDVSACLDSIQIQEHLVFDNSEGTPDRAKMLTQLNSFKELLARKQNQIDQLMKEKEALNQSSKKTIQNLQNMIAYLNQQLVEKQEKIERLEQLCQKKDMTIQDLRSNVTQLAAEADMLQQQTVQQDTEINTGYYVMGSKKELKNKGVLKGGFLRRTKVDSDNMDCSAFTRIDVRNFRSVTIPSKSPSLMSGNPSDSYTLTQNDDGTTTLQITNPARFWNVSRFLIIEY